MRTSAQRDRVAPLRESGWPSATSLTRSARSTATSSSLAISPGDGPHLPGDHSDEPERAESEPDHGADVQLPASGAA